MPANSYSFLALLLLLQHCCAPAAEFSQAFRLHTEYQNGDWVEQMQLRGALKLSAHKVNGLRAVELSALAWDEDEQLLYALSDNGHLLHLSVTLENGQLTAAELQSAHVLRDPQGNPLPSADRDAEGLEIIKADNGQHGDTELLVSFEIRPRIIIYSTRGEWLRPVALPAELADISNYYGRNSALESVVMHPRFGILTLPQHALKSTPAGSFALHSVDGNRWLYPPVDEDSAAVGMAMAPDHSIIVLERIYKSIFQPVRFALRQLTLDIDDTGPQASIRELFQFNSTENWRVDNFEGIAHHQDGRYFIISDDNNSAIQKTLLLYVTLDPQRQVSE